MDAKNKSLAFCLVKYFPHGGLQRDMVLIARACQARGYAIHVYTTSWQGAVPEGFTVHAMGPAGWTNHGRLRRYSQWLAAQLADRPVDGVVGFNKMPGLDVYFAADPCFVERTRRQPRLLRRLSGRYRVYAQFEAAVFTPSSPTEILLIAEPQQAAFQKYYGTPAQRLHLLPPWIAPDRNPPENRPKVRAAIRRELGVSDEALLLVQVGSPFGTKGVDRTLRAVAGLPEAVRARTQFVVVGHDPSRRYPRLSARLGLAGSVRFAGIHDDVMAVLAAADLMVHPARTEAAGVVLIEALASGLPVLCSGVCGHAGQIRLARAGVVLPEPFRQEDLNRELAGLLTAGRLADYAAHASAFARARDFHSMPQQAADLIESVVARKVRRAPAM